MKDISVEGSEFVILLACVDEWWLHFFPWEKLWCVSSLMCLTSADLLSRPELSQGRQISFFCSDVMSRHWVDTGQCWGTPLTDDNHCTILSVLLLFPQSFQLQSRQSFSVFILLLIKKKLDWLSYQVNTKLLNICLIPQVPVSIRELPQNDAHTV